MTLLDKPNARFRHMYAVLRIDLPVSQDNPKNSIAVVKVFSSETTAEHEVLRLNRINARKGCRYVSKTARLGQAIN